MPFPLKASTPKIVLWSVERYAASMHSLHHHAGKIRASFAATVLSDQPRCMSIFEGPFSLFARCAHEGTVSELVRFCLRFVRVAQLGFAILSQTGHRQIRDDADDNDNDTVIVLMLEADDRDHDGGGQLFQGDQIIVRPLGHPCWRERVFASR